MAYNLENSVQNGWTVKVHYTGTYSNGEVFDSSRSRGEPIMFKVGAGQMIPGFDKAIVGMSQGEVKNISLSPSDAYGEQKPQLFQVFPKENFPPDLNLIEGQVLSVPIKDGNPVPAKIHEIKEDRVVLDFNHPLAGQEINFEIELVSFEPNGALKL